MVRSNVFRNFIECRDVTLVGISVRDRRERAFYELFERVRGFFVALESSRDFLP